MLLVINLKKGYSLIEILVSLVLLSALLICTGSLFLIGLKYKVSATYLYDDFYTYEKVIHNFERLRREYQQTHLMIDESYLKSGDQIILSYLDNELTFYFKEGIIDTIKDCPFVTFNVNHDLLYLEIKNGEQIERRYYYFGGYL